MLPALIAAAAEGAVAAEGAAAAATAAEGATAAAEGAVVAGSQVETAKKLLDGGSNHNNPPQKSGFAGVGESLGKALDATGPGTDLSGGNSLYRSF